MATDGSSGDEALRRKAVDRLKRRRNFFTHLLVYAVVNAFLVVIWAIGSRNFFWPIFVIVGWGIAVLVNAWNVFYRNDDDEERIRQEMERLRKQA